MYRRNGLRLTNPSNNSKWDMPAVEVEEIAVQLTSVKAGVGDRAMGHSRNQV
jgi:hypothetical protein